MPKLKVTLPEAGEVTHELTDENITVGRVEDNSLQIDHASVSSHHAQLALLPSGNYQLTDLNSTNGTRVNGKPVTEAALRNGDRVRFGNIDTAYLSGDESRSEPLPAAVEPEAKPAAESHRPSNFENASPFQKKNKEKDPVGTYILIFAGVSVLAFIAALVTVFLLHS